MADLTELTACDACQAMGAGETTPEALVCAVRERIAAREPEVRAWIARDDAAVDRQLHALAGRAVEDRGPLHGLPIGVKDLYNTHDFPTGYGSPIYTGFRPRTDAAAVARLRAAGAIIMGKTVTTEFAYWHPGPTRNPHNTAHSPGGSSSGSAAAVADRMVPAALGSQTAASVIRPAAYCGIVGFKPSYGRISLAGVKPLAHSMDTAGVLARTVADAGFIAGAMAARPDWMQPLAAVDAPSLALLRTPDWDQVSAEGRQAVVAAATALAGAGARVEDRTAPDAHAGLSAVQTTIMQFEVARNLEAEWQAANGDLSDQLRGLLSEGRAISAETYEAARRAWARAAATLDDLFAGADALLSPSALGEAPRFEAGTGDPVMCRSWTLLGLPSLTLPCGTGPSGLPLGLQLVARPGADKQLLDIAGWVSERLAG